MPRARADQPQKGRLVDLSKGMVDVVHPALLDDSESKLLKNATLDEKGTLRPCPGRIERFASAPGSSPVAGMAPFYKPDGTSRLLFGTEDGKLYADSPHLISTYDTQGDYNAGQNFGVQADTAGKLWPMIITTGFEDSLFVDFHTRDSGWMIDDTVYKTGAKSAKGTGTNQKLIREFGVNASQAYIKLACRFAETNQLHYPVIFKSSTDSEVQVVVAGSDGHFKYHNGTGLVNFPVDKTYSANTWYVVEVWIRGGIFWVNIDGQSLAPDGLTMKDTANAAQTQTSKFQIQNAGGTAATTWIDDVTINLLGPVLTRPSVAYKSDGSQAAVNLPRFETVGGRQGVMSEEGATNILDANQASVETDTTGFIEYNSVTLTRVTAEHWHGGASLKVDCLGTSGNAEGFYTSGKSGTASQTYTGSIYLKAGSGSEGKEVIVRLWDAQNSQLSSNKIVALTNQWQRIVTNPLTIGGSGSSNLRILVNGKFGGTVQGVYSFYADGMQIEQKPHATSWQLPSAARSPEVLTIPTAGVFNKGNWAVELTFTPTSSISTTNNHWLWDLKIDDNNLYRLITYTNNALGLQVISGGVTKSIITSTSFFQVGTKYDIMASGNGSVMRLCINGVQIGTDIAYTEPVGTLPELMYIGSYSFQANGIYYDIRFSDRARTLAEHQAYVASGLPIPLDDTTTLLMPCNGNLDVSATHHWISPVIDCSNALEKGSGHAALTATTPGASTVAIASRSAPASTGPWTEWVAALGDGTLQHVADNYVQVRVTLARDGENDPYVDKLVVSFDGQAAATLLASDFVAGGQFYFATLLSKMVVVNKLNAPRKYDGTTLSALGGSPPNAQFVAAHKNFLFMAHTAANPSRLYFSEVLNLESWPALNFIDVSPDDGDWITQLLPYDDYLIIAKNRSIWILVGGGTSDFEVRRLHAEIGCVAPRSLVRMGEAFAFVAHDGIYLSDRVQPVLIGERLKKTWQSLNRRRLSQACAVYYDHKLRVDLPNGNSTINNFRIIYDTIRKALYEQEFTDHASCYAKFVEAGQEVLLYGHSNEGQISQADTGTTDAGAPINFEWESKHFDNGLPEHIKRWRKAFMEFAPAASDTVVNVAFVVDGGAASAAVPITVPGDTTKKVHTARLLPSQVGVVQGHSIGYRVTQSTTNGGVGIHACILDYFIKGARPTI